MRFLVAGIIILLLSTCLSQPDCIVTATNNVKISLYKLNVDSVHLVQFSLITVSGTDSLFQNVTNPVSSLVIPVNPFTNQTTFKFQYTTTINSTVVTRSDTLTLNYSRLNAILSPECGGYTYYTNLVVGATSFLQVEASKNGEFTNPKIVNNQLSTSATVNLKIKL